MASDQRAFCVAALPLLKEGSERTGIAFLYDLLGDKNILPLCDPSLLSLEDEVVIARAVMQKEPLLDVKLARRITAAGRESETLDPVAALRILEVVAAISDGVRVVPMLIQMLREPDVQLRSKAALLVGRVNKSVQWAEQLLREPDARVRANSVEALWNVEHEGVRDVLWQAVKDSNNRVQGNALLGLYRLGDIEVLETLLAMARHSSATFRATAAWVMGESGDPRFQPVLAQMIRETDAAARHAVFRALSLIKQAMARRQERPALRVALCQQWIDADGLHCVHAAITLPDQTEIPKLSPTRVVLSQNCQIVNRYKIARRPQDWLVTGVALPARRVSAVEVESKIEDAVREWIGQMAASERAMILRYAAKDMSNPDEPEFRAPPPGPLLSDAGPLTATLEDLENRYLYPDSLQALFNTVSVATGARHLLLIEDQSGGSAAPEIHPARWTSLIRDAQANSVSVSAVKLAKPGQPPGALRDVATQTGGLFASVTDPEQIHVALERLRFGLLHPYIITFPSEEKELLPLKLQIYADEGYGEDSLD